MKKKKKKEIKGVDVEEFSSKRFENNMEVWYNDVGSQFFTSEERKTIEDRECGYCKDIIKKGDKYIFEQLGQISFSHKLIYNYVWFFHLDCYNEAIKKLLHRKE